MQKITLEELIETKNAFGRDCTDLRLAGLDLNKINFSNADLRGVDLTKSTLDWCDLSSAKLEGAHINEATFYHADLSWCNLTNVIAYGARFIGTNLTKAILHKAHLLGATIESVTSIDTDFRAIKMEGLIVHSPDIFLFSGTHHPSLAWVMNATLWFSVGCESHPYRWWLNKDNTNKLAEEWGYEDSRRDLLLNWGKVIYTYFKKRKVVR